MRGEGVRERWAGLRASCHRGLSESVRIESLVQASCTFLGGRSDREVIVAGDQTAGFAVLPLHENLKLVGVPDDADAANAHSALLDLISLVWDPVVPERHMTSPLALRRKAGSGAAGPLGAADAPSRSLLPGLL